MRLGIYVAAGPNPIFMRMLMLQIARQTKLPDYIAIYENGNKTSGFHWVCKEIIEELQGKGVKILHSFNTYFAGTANVHREALTMLLKNTDSEVFLKMDTDDFYGDQYIENTSSMVTDNDWAINLNSGMLLVRPAFKDFKIKKSAVMVHSPLGAAPTHIAFNRKFAELYLKFLEAVRDNEEAVDDDVMSGVLKHVNTRKVDGPTDYVYVSHGGNYSSAAWQSTGGRVYFDQ